MIRILALLALLGLVGLAGCAAPPAAPPSGAPPARAAATPLTLPPMKTFGSARLAPPARPNAQMAGDFLDLAFRMESGRRVPVLSRFEGPISVRVAGSAPATLRRDLDALLGRLRREAGIDISTRPGGSGTITVEAIPLASLQRAVPRAACFVVPRVGSWQEFLNARRGNALDWTTLTTRRQAAIFVPSDAPPQEIRDCLHEELAQALGPLNDLYRLPDSVFNDDNIHTILTPFDMLMLRVHYAPDLRSGMAESVVAARLPAILARINPAGERASGGALQGTGRDYVEAIQTATDQGAAPARRRAAADRAVRIANRAGWGGARAGFAHYIQGRLRTATAPEVALASFRRADRLYGQAPGLAIHRAHVAAQLAAYTLSRGDAAGTLALTEPAIRAAADHQNAALLATLLMFRAEALSLLNREDEARAARLDSLGWARYGFGSDRVVRDRAGMIAALNPARRF